MAFEDFDPIFSKPKVEVEWASQSSRPFFFHAYSPDSSHLRDIVRIGGSWSEFAGYFVTSLKSQDLKLLLELDSSSYGVVSHAKLVAQKSKGMPLITIPLIKLVDSAAAMEVKSNFCSSLSEAFEIKSMECSLEKVVSYNISLKEMKPYNWNSDKSFKISNSENGVSTDGLQNSPDKQAAWDTGATKVKNRKVPAHRRQYTSLTLFFHRTKVRGALLHDSDE
ncbi:hypothetical protein D0Y65_019175 [Glycine soja]|uniref:Uncharacterized protein n=1 Tax=Glycine soja TaxID=3848 RepID=A0A445J7Y1_GLYSO|nr:hypothetical protein D0Y65_019175 [Glycine soja]